MFVRGFLLVKDWVACDPLWPVVPLHQGGHVFVSVYSFVNRITLKAIDEFWRNQRKWPKELSIRFWWWSGLLSGCRTFLNNFYRIGDWGNVGGGRASLALEEEPKKTMTATHVMRTAERLANSGSHVSEPGITCYHRSISLKTDPCQKYYIYKRRKSDGWKNWTVWPFAVLLLWLLILNLEFL